MQFPCCLSNIRSKFDIYDRGKALSNTCSAGMHRRQCTAQKSNPLCLRPISRPPPPLPLHDLLGLSFRFLFPSCFIEFLHVRWCGIVTISCTFKSYDFHSFLIVCVSHVRHCSHGKLHLHKCRRIIKNILQYIEARRVHCINSCRKGEKAFGTQLHDVTARDELI